MRVLEITDTAVDLLEQVAPFQPNYSVVIHNDTAGQLVLQESDVEGSGYTTLATIPANEYANVTFNEQYVKVSTAASLWALGN